MFNVFNRKTIPKSVCKELTSEQLRAFDEIVNQLATAIYDLRMQKCMPADQPLAKSFKIIFGVECVGEAPRPPPLPLAATRMPAPSHYVLSVSPLHL